MLARHSPERARCDCRCRWRDCTICDEILRWRCVGFAGSGRRQRRGDLDRWFAYPNQRSLKERLLTRFDLATRRAAWCCKASRLPGVSPGGVRGNGLPVLVVMDVEIMGAVVVMDVNWR